ncbi:cytochrome b5-like heme/steroid binding domain-containing protein [Lactarius vividus]|nr:cytochrome b5-like heme/steroid binding domain-containing protein [Lactarius vividus]
MASYLRTWLPTLSTQQSNSRTTGEEEGSPTTPTNPTLTIEEPDADDDFPPAFPAIGSAQRTSLMPPPTTTRPPTQASKSKKREKVVLAPGHSPLDWAALKTSGADLRGGATSLARIPPSVLRVHNKRDDAWAAFSGKVYNITPYLAFHPGGEKELMRVAGRDGTKLFALTHAWVNVDFMLDACLVGFLVPEPSS